MLCCSGYKGCCGKRPKWREARAEARAVRCHGPISWARSVEGVVWQRIQRVLWRETEVEGGTCRCTCRAFISWERSVAGVCSPTERESVEGVVCQWRKKGVRERLNEVEGDAATAPGVAPLDPALHEVAKRLRAAYDEIVRTVPERSQRAPAFMNARTRILAEERGQADEYDCRSGATRAPHEPPHWGGGGCEASRAAAAVFCCKS